ncbi:MULTISPECIES: RNA-directed DNA polymerase [Aerococcus]|uniref:RNA-directed DNA polymerase n=1 Tax=Aerococcus urinae (strain CCUG 59500 / ACS-120-V-Col10a) TaxID=2976812 RepID=UPI00227A09E9|nr:RNA-directed DNA polymerase [Aerococcus sp. Group 1]MCY3030600.1 RNA-directed DNA polymerase [Aerococcus sp. Group 1]MCY3054728.1 RNA-directed DNA polymerase [Aerococcus sp. Group 1]MCY3056458.1 RNA-directed DNA polymerase [Aerococcus sp. Group 1]MCY3061283.1 RNA-directed DNA polymerase [Aerococcus sp. Group 1]
MDQYISILDMDSEQAKKFFLESTSYSTIHLPPYFTFDEVISKAENKLRKSKLKEFEGSKIKIDDLPDVNYTLFANKNGKYSWRPLTLIHPLAYVDLVNLICKKDNWSLILKILINSEVENIKCMSIPLKAIKNKQQSKETILNWWRNMEQTQIALSLEYESMLNTDITDCYSSIYTHSIEWAIDGKDNAKENRKIKGEKKGLGRQIDIKLSNMQFGQTNGIPQGSVLMDVIAEVVLAAIDIELEREINKYFIDTKSVNRYRILRYRDDYKVFVNSRQDAEQILKILTQVLMPWNFKLSERKTSFSDNLILDSIKSDKLNWNKTAALFSNKATKISIQKELLEILNLSKTYPNSGSLSKAMTNLYKNKINSLEKLPVDYEQIIAITVDLFINNPRVIEIGITILSKIFSLINTDNKKIEKIIRAIDRKIKKSSNSEYAEIWLQRLAIPYGIPLNYDSILCQKVNDPKITIWNSNWIKGKEDSKKYLNKIIDKKEIDKLELIIPLSDVDPFYE